MNTAAAALAAEVSRSTILRRIHAGLVKADKIDGRWVIDEDSLRAHFKIGAPVDTTPAPAAPAPVSTEDAIRTAYWQLARFPQDWILITRLREKLADLDRADVDATLARMERHDLHLVPEADQKLLTEADRAAAVLIGGTPKHLVALEG